MEELTGVLSAGLLLGPSPPLPRTGKISPLLQVQKSLHREKLNRYKAWTEQFPLFLSSSLRQKRLPMVAMELTHLVTAPHLPDKS